VKGLKIVSSQFMVEENQLESSSSVRYEFCDVVVSKDLIWGTLTIYKDSILLIEGVDYTRMDNSTHYIFRIVYSHSAHTIEISGTYAISEFSSIVLILSLLMLATLVVVVMSKRRSRQRFSPYALV
jgi:hypothetical protein